MAVGLTIVGVGMLLMERITPGMPYGQLWWNLTLLGVGMGLVMTPMTAAVMGAVPRARAGMASATSNASREVGGVFGIALLGAIVTHWFAKDLRNALAAFPLPAAVKEKIVTLAGQGGGTAKGSLPTGVDPVALHHAVDSAFVSGMHVGLPGLGGGPADRRRRGGGVRAPRGPRGTAGVAPGAGVRRDRRAGLRAGAVRRRPLNRRGGPALAGGPARVGADVRGQD